MIETLKGQRAYVKGRITHFYNNVSKEKLNKFQLTTIEHHIKTLYEKYEVLQDKIEHADESELKKNDRVDFENNYCSLEVLIMEKLFEIQSEESDNKQDGNKQGIEGGIGYVPKCRLPEIELPRFDGKYTSWLTFKDDYENLIHKNESIEDIDKFRYLISCVRNGDAYSIIEYIPRTMVNYSVAWQRLLESYDNDAIVKRNYMKDIYDISPVKEDSASSLQNFVDTFLKFFNALKALNYNVSNWDLFLVEHLSRKLDYRSRVEVESKSSSNELLTIDQFIKILTDRCRFMQAISNKSFSNDSRSRPTNVSSARRRINNSSNNHSMVATSYKCGACLDSDHLIYQCEKFLAKTPFERFDVVKKNKLCLNCLNMNHIWQKCRSKFNCRACGKRHHFLLHRNDTQPKSITLSNLASGSSINSDKHHPSSVNATENQTQSQQFKSVNDAMSLTSTHIVENFKPKKQILIASAVVWVVDDSGLRTPCRLILDSGSQVNFISESFCKKLNVKRKLCNLSVLGIGESTANPQHMVSLSILSRVSNFNAELDFLILPKITNNLPTLSFEFDKSQLPSTFELADPYFNKADKVDMLIGAELYHEIVLAERVKLIDKFPAFQSSQLGYIVCGKVESDCVTFCGVSCVATLEEINSNVKRFWSLESIESPVIMSTEERECEKHYAAHVVREKNGRYSVSLPTNSKISQLGESKHQAKMQFLRLEQQLIKNSEMQTQYVQFMEEYLSLCHMEASPETHNLKSPEYFLPHHCVTKTTSEGRKFRVVFNGSFKSSSKLSLNDVLNVGPTIQQDLFSILARFRMHKYAFTADIIKMYRQVKMNESDRELQKIWWRSSPKNPLRIFRLCTVTYGTACAAFLAIRSLKQLALDERDKFQKASDVIMNDFYVDDVLSGGDDLESVKTLRIQLAELLSLGCFQLSKFAANFSDIASENISSSNESDNLNSITQNSNIIKIIQILGVDWYTEEDLLSISFKSSTESSSITKRSVLSEITKIFDPLGLCAPIVFTAKCIMQKLWSDPELAWDDDLPTNLRNEWIEFLKDIMKIEKVAVPRCVKSVTNAVTYSLHGFGDASERGYGCCIYLTSTNSNGEMTSRLVCSKSRVAPLRKQSIPRLELCAAVLLSQLMDKVNCCIKIEFDKLYFWTDSTITLFRIKSSPSKYGTFVANRISLIQEISQPSNWYYVPSELNPADIVSRGLMPSQILNNVMWWNGPDFINDSSKALPIQPSKSTDYLDDEYRRSEVVMLHCDVQILNKSFAAEIFTKFSSLMKLLRTIALCLRFITNCRNKIRGSDLQTDNLRPNEIDLAMMKLVVLHQSHVFSEDLTHLKQKKLLLKRSKLIKLAPFIDENHIIRVGGRLHHSNLSYEQKHQILLSDDTLSYLIARHEHLNNLHAGPQALLNIIRKRFWILNGRNVCRKVVHQCLRCFRMRPIVQKQVMGQLPYERVNPSRPFLTVGIDFCGPFHVAYKIRSKITSKVYISVFVCFCTKACHFELVHDLTTGGFIAAFRRFVARRGLPSVVFSDNATNFAGAQSELNQLFHQFTNETQNHELIGFLTSKGITWKNIPPRSPHFGGLWEAAVKSAKGYLKKTISTEKFTAEELGTIINEVEAVLNSRPLTPMSSDPNDLNALTPGHFLIGDHLTALPDPSLLDIKFNTLSRWQRIQFIVQMFWKRWSHEYLNELQQRHKWHKHCKIVNGTMVIIKDDNLPSMKWVLGRITKTYVGVDSSVRVVDVKTQHGIFKRPVARICILPFEGNNDNE